jgi:glutamate 5-kinase
MSTRDNLKNKQRIVIKIGTSSLTFPNGKLNFQRIERLVKVLNELASKGHHVILVSSGAVAVGSSRLGMEQKPVTLVEKQALAAIGQAELIRIYQKFFDEFGQLVAQVLLTRDVITTNARRRTARDTMNALLDMHIIPIINENDTVSTAEIEFGDNDTLSAYVSELVNADLLVLYSDIDGLYSADPRKVADASIIPLVEDITPSIELMASGSGSGFATGGMATKIAAAKICMEAGIDMIITNGANPAVIHDILAGDEIGTLFFFSQHVQMKT